MKAQYGKVVRVESSYTAGQSPEVSRLNLASLEAAANSALMFGQNHHNCKPADAMRVEEHRYSGHGQPNRVASLRCEDLRHGLQLALSALKDKTGNAPFKVTILFAGAAGLRLTIAWATLY